MSTTYFNNSNIKRLKNKKVSKKKDVTDNEKVVESFTPSGSNKEENPKSNIFGSSDSDKTPSPTPSPTTSPTGATSGTSATGKQDSNTTTDASSQLDSGSILVFCLHALLSVLFVYIWGAFATNYLYLCSESKENLDYILPIDEFKLPYSDDPTSESWYKYGFPYDLSDRSIDTDDRPGSISKIKDRQISTIYFPWLSKEGEANNKTNKYAANFFGAFVQYLFQAVYSGLAKGGRKTLRDLLDIISVAPPKNNAHDSWNELKDSFPRKIIAFVLFPFIALQFLIPVMFIITAAFTFIFGIIQEHIWWGIIFSFTIGMFVAMGCGVYMGLQTFYVFFLYPWVNNRPRNEGTRWGDIFNSLKTYMLIAFYILICFYSYEDLGPYGCGGVAVIVVASIAMQYWQNQSSK